MVAAAEISLSQVEENLEGFRLQRIGFLQFELTCRVLFFSGQQHTQSEMQLHIIFVQS